MLSIQHARWKRLRDLVLFVAIAACVIPMGLLAAQMLGHEKFIRWGGLLGNTSILFGCFIVDSRHFCSRLSFWMMTCSLLVLHLAVFALVLVRVSEWKLIWFMAMYLEAFPLWYFRNLLMTRTSSARRRWVGERLE